MQELRHKADYDPFEKLNKTDVLAAIYSSKEAIDDLKKVNERHKGAFSVLLLFPFRENT